MTLLRVVERTYVGCGNYSYPSIYATEGAELWQGSKEKILTLPSSRILNCSSLFQLPFEIPMDKNLIIKTDQQSDVYLCFSKKKPPWSEQTLVSIPFNFQKNNKEVLFTTSGNFDIYHKKTTCDTTDDQVMYLPIPEQSLSSAAIFIKTG